MRHMLGDYYSNIPEVGGLILFGIILFILFIVIIVQMRRAEVKRRRELNAPPIHTRSTYQAAHNMRMSDLNSIAKETNAISRTRP